jgi:ferredoxin
VPYFPHMPDLRRTRSELEIVGTPLDKLRPAAFRVPGTLRSRLIPGWLVRLIRPFVWIRPAISDACVKCGLCVEACPVAALSRAPGEPPVLAPAKCIGCCCCHEVCPAKAIEMTQSPLLNRVRRGRLP